MNIREVISNLSKIFNIDKEYIIEIFRGIEKSYNDPLEFSKLISKFLSDFDTDVEKADKYYAEKRYRFIEGKLSSTYFYYNYSYSKNQFINDLTTSLKPQLNDQIKYWEKILHQLPKNVDKTKLEIDAEFKLGEIIKEYKSFCDSKRDTKIHKPILNKNGKTTSEKEYVIQKPYIFYFFDKKKLENIYKRIEHIVDHLSIETKNKFYSELVYDSQNLNKRLYKKDDIDFINDYVNTIKKMLQISGVEDNSSSSETITEFDPNHFSEDSYRLFRYLVEEYVKIDVDYAVKRRFTNVYHFMKTYNRKEYRFFFTENEFKAFILKKYSLTITNTDKADKYESVELVILNDLVLKFEALYKAKK